MPSRSRPKKSLETYRKWSDTVSTQFILSLDQDDPSLSEYLDIYPDYFKLKPMPPGDRKWGRCFSDNFVIIVNKNRSAVDAINKAAEVCLGEVIIVVSDDTEPVEEWYTNLYKAIDGKEDYLLKTKDGIQDYIVTMTVMDQKYYERDGYIYHPDFKHQFADTYLTCVADIRGRLIKSDLEFKHNHYSVLKETPDALHKRNDDTWKEGKNTFAKLMKQFTPEERARITDKNMKGFMRFAGI